MPLYDLNKPILLLTTEKMQDADILVNLLIEHKIPAFKKRLGEYGGEAGDNSLGEQIYVPERLFHPALEIAEPFLAKIDAEIAFTEEELTAASEEHPLADEDFVNDEDRDRDGAGIDETIIFDLIFEWLFD